MRPTCVHTQRLSAELRQGESAVTGAPRDSDPGPRQLSAQTWGSGVTPRAATGEGEVLAQKQLTAQEQHVLWGDGQGRQAVTLKLGSPDGNVTGVRQPLGPWKPVIEMDSLFTKFSLEKKCNWATASQTPPLYSLF